MRQADTILVQMLQGTHPSDNELEIYFLGSVSDAALDKIEEHLLTCERCRNELALSEHYVLAIKIADLSSVSRRRLRFIHLTEEGPIFGAIHSSADGKWIARQWGRELDGGRTLASVEDASTYLRVLFDQIFPEHACSAQCREELR